MTVRGVEPGAGGTKAKVPAGQENILTQTFIQVGSKIIQYTNIKLLNLSEKKKELKSRSFISYILFPSDKD